MKSKPLDQTGKNIMALHFTPRKNLNPDKGLPSARCGDGRKGDKVGLGVEGVVRLVPLEREIFEHGARLRALHGLKLIDALHVATAVHHRANVFLSNDQSLVASLSAQSEILAVSVSTPR